MTDLAKAIKETYDIVKSNHENYCTISIYEEECGNLVGNGSNAQYVPNGQEGATLFVTSCWNGERISIRAKVDFMNFLEPTENGAVKAAKASLFAENCGVTIDTGRSDVWIIDFGDDKNLAVATIKDLFAMAQFGINKKPIVTTMIHKPLRKDFLVNYLTYENGESSAEYIIADARNIQGVFMYSFMDDMPPALQQLKECQQRGEFNATLYVTKKDVTEINDATSIIGIDGWHYNGRKEAKQNYCVVMHNITEGANTNPDRDKQIQRVLKYLSNIKGVKFLNPLGKSNSIPFDKVSGKGLIIRCGENWERAAMLSLMFLGDLKYNERDCMVTTIS